MRDAAVPGDDEQPVVRKNVAKHVGVRKNRAQHQRPRDDSSTRGFKPNAGLQPGIWACRLQAKHVRTTKNRLADQRARDAVCDGVHAQSLPETADTPWSVRGSLIEIGRASCRERGWIWVVG